MTLPSSLPGLTRQSKLSCGTADIAETLGMYERGMDARVKPAHDAVGKTC
jgi:hypothetical protein